MAAERREVEDRRDGNLPTVLRGYVLLGETRVELERLASEDGADRAKVHGARVL